MTQRKAEVAEEEEEGKEGKGGKEEAAVTITVRLHTWKATGDAYCYM